MLRPSLVLSFCLLAHAIILPESNLATADYDFVIVGGGTAGNVIANRLSENPQVNVLLLEAGPSDAGVLDIQIPFLCTHTSPQTPWDWNYTTVPQPGLNGASIAYPRGHVLGGSSSINCLVYTRGSRADFDRYAAHTNDTGWSWNSMLSYFKKSERFTPPADHHNISGQFDPAVHGFDGLNSVSLPAASTGIDSLFSAAIHQLGGDFSFTEDTNSGVPLGFGWSQAVIDGPTGSRSSSSSGYLSRQFLSRRNLHVLLNAQVSRILKASPDNSSQFSPRFRDVEFRVNGGGPLLTVTANREIILSAGSINTPQILLNSGIGNATVLKSWGVEPIVNLPSVGMNLSDHPIITLSWRVNSSTTYDDYNRNTTFLNAAIADWNATREGPLANGIAQHIGFIRVADNSSIFESSPNPAAGTNSPHYEVFVSNFLLGNTPSNGSYISMSAIMLTPGSQSRGSVMLNVSSSATQLKPFQPPIIDAGLLLSMTDVPLMREAVRSILHLASAPSWTNYIISAVDHTQPGLSSSDEDVDLFIRQNARSAYHVVGTSSMSPQGAPEGVTDPDLKVKRVDGVRIVDASVLPFVPAGHTQASVYALAERAADLIKADNSN